VTNKNYLLALLTAIMVFNYVDRIALGLLQQDIKHDLALSDTQLGFMTGIAFALFYAVMGIPIARWADRGNRVTIITITTGLWSIAVALCGAAASFTQLLLLRVGVAIGEAGCHPPAFSLISDYFDRAKRPQALARYALGWSFAVIIGFFVAGWLNELYGWRTTFVILGAPGVLLAMLTAFTVREPRRVKGNTVISADGSPTNFATIEPPPHVREVFRTLWFNKAFRHLLLCFSLSYFFGNGIMQWQPAFFTRTHGLSTGELGTWFAVIYGLGGLLGTYVGGELSSRYAANNERLQFAGLAALYVVLAPLAATVYLASDYRVSFVVLAVYATAAACVNGPMFAATQTLVPARMRAMSIAIVLFFSNLIGLGLGPLAAGALSDALRAALGEESLRYSLLALCPGYLWCAWHLWRASRTITVVAHRAPGGDQSEEMRMRMAIAER
jgi:MFS transporter, Spinster family, sphingosine-1-phosphate transporter